jgi:hypothetical protein
MLTLFAKMDDMIFALFCPMERMMISLAAKMAPKPIATQWV